MVSSFCVAATVAVLSAPAGALTLEDAYQRAAASSEAVRASAATVRRAEILRGTPWTTVAPTLSATAEAVTQTEVVVGGVLVTPADQLRGRVELEQPLVRSGFFATRRAAMLSLEAARGDDARVRQQLMMDSVEAFIGVLRSRQQVQVALGALARAEAQEKSAESRAKAGAALRTTVLLSTIE
ncbi:MAG TPA: TolC family protein, partial [Planctomycetota bacterium]|nr:TolC family protein [Planctomycetota bacterium]